MGKAVIVSEQGEGLYTIKKEVRGLAAARALAADRRERLEAELPDLRLEEEAAINAVVYQRFVTDTLLNDWLAGIEIPEDTLNFELRYGITDEARAYVRDLTAELEVPAALMNAIHDLVEKRMLLDDIRRQIDRKSAEYLAVLKWQGELTALENIADAEIPAWCADYTEGLTGEVATLEVPGEVDPPIGGGLNIRPGYEDNSAWSAKYGQIQFGKTLSPAGFAWNLTMLQPWLKWNPLWRYGTITAIAGDLATVALDPILSKARVYLGRETGFNQPYEPLTDVEIEYMGCNGTAFEINDRVIVDFTLEAVGDVSSYTPKVIGFISNPRPCAAHGFLCRPQSSSETLSNKILTRRGTGWESRNSIYTHYYNTTWRGESVTLCWVGPYGRDIPPPYISGIVTLGFGGFWLQVLDDHATAIRPQNIRTYVRWENKIFTSVQNRLYTAPGLVVAAALRVVNDEQQLICVTHDTNLSNLALDRFWWRPFSEDNLTSVAAWTLIDEWEHPTAIGIHRQGWRFNSSGTEARCILSKFLAEDSSSFGRPALFSVTTSGGAFNPSEISTAGPITIDKTVSESLGETLFTSESQSSSSGSAIVAVDWTGTAWITATATYNSTTSGDLTINKEPNGGSGSSSESRNMTLNGITLINYNISSSYISGNNEVNRTTTISDYFLDIAFLDLRDNVFLAWRTMDINKDIISYDRRANPEEGEGVYWWREVTQTTTTNRNCGYNTNTEAQSNQAAVDDSAAGPINDVGYPYFWVFEDPVTPYSNSSQSISTTGFYFSVPDAWQFDYSTYANISFAATVKDGHFYSMGYGTGILNRLRSNGVSTNIEAVTGLTGANPGYGPIFEI
jgi:hypothetical protein